MGVTTNPLENINLKLKSKMGHGYLTQKSAFRKLKGFEIKAKNPKKGTKANGAFEQI